MNAHLYSLATLQSLTPEKINLLQQLGITNLGDLLAYQPFRYAGFIRAAKDQLLRKEEIVSFLDKAVRDKSVQEILTSPAENIKGLGSESANVLKQLSIKTIADLASYPPFAEAEEIVTNAVSDEDDPYAPTYVLPTCKKFTRNSKSFVSFFKQEEIRALSVNISSSKSLISSLFNFASNESKIIYLGYSVSYIQDWIYCGIHLGEPLGSVSLFMGQDTQVSILDWRRINRAIRTEDTRVSERLSNILLHQRAVDEVARATAEEHQHGGTSAFGANAATAGSFVAAGAIVGGVGGGISGALAGLVLGNVANVAGGAPTLAGAAVGTAVGSIAGAAAGSLIFSGATTLGFVETDAEGDREIYARSGQNIQQRTIQNSSSLRSFWSNIVSQSVQEEEQRIRTDRVTNHNRIHALNALYFEVLNEYRLNISANDFAPILFLPFKPIQFTETILRRYWWIIRTYLADQKLVLALDEHFLALSSDPSPATELAELPRIEDIKTLLVEVELNLDGSAMEDLVLSALAQFTGLLQYAMDLFYESLKRDQIGVSLITSGGITDLVKTGPPGDPNYIGLFTTSSRIPIHTIEKIKITNKNPEFTLGLGPIVIDINELIFEGVSAKITVRDKSSLTDVLPEIGSLEVKQDLGGQLKVSANRSKEVRWNVADQLRNLFEGISAQLEELTAELESEELVEAKVRNLLGFLNANKFGFTRLILQSTEREQVISALEEVEVGGVELSSIASTIPLGFCGNHVVLPLKNRPSPGSNYDPIQIDTFELEFKLGQFDEIDVNDLEKAVAYTKGLSDFLDKFIQSVRKEDNRSVHGEQLLDRLQALKTLLDQFHSFIDLNGNVPPNSLILREFEARIRSAINDLLRFIKSPTRTNDSDVSRLRNYYNSVKSSLAGKMGQIINSEEISLPSPAVFMEPVLSHAKGAELYDMRRNSHYEILPAPGIGTADPNVIRSEDIQLVPNVPTPSLTIQNAPDYPLPSSINTALAEAGKLDLSTLINANAGTLNSTLSNLSSVAAELAKASAQLTGDAQKQVLASASEVAKQVGDIISKSLQTPSVSPPSPKPEPPKGTQSKAEVVRELDRINKGGGSDKEKKEKKETIGAPVAQDEKRDYQMSIQFLDKDGLPYNTDAFKFTLTMTFFELPPPPIEFNGGVPIPISEDGFFFPETIPLTKGRKAQIRVNADIDSIVVSGIKEFILPDHSDIVFKCQMKTETQRVSETDVKSAVDEAIKSGSFSFALKPLFELFLNGVKFPFRIFEISVDGGGKVEIPLEIAYNRPAETTTTETGITKVTKYEVIKPINGWDIEVV